jgi:serine protease Do
VIVILSDGRQFRAKVLERVDRYDLAVLQIDGDNLPVAELGSSDDLAVGEWAIAIGSPFGYLLADTRPTVTVGVISALNRDIKQANQERTYLGMIQTDAAINPGNSGGALVNIEGKVVGINTFIFTESGGSIGIGFAVPIERAQWIIAEVREFGRYREPNWGFVLSPLSPGIVRYYGLDDPVGFIVNDVQAGSPAWEAGIRPRDIMREIDGVRLDSRDTVTRLVYEAMVGDRLSFVAERNGHRFSGEIVLEERP